MAAMNSGKSYRNFSFCVLLIFGLLLSACDMMGTERVDPLGIPQILRTVSAEDLGATALIDVVATDDGYLLMAATDYSGVERVIITFGNDLVETARRSVDVNAEALLQNMDCTGRLMTTAETAFTDPFSIGVQNWAYSVGSVLYVYNTSSLSRNSVEITLPQKANSIYYIKGMLTLAGNTYAVLEEKDTRNSPYKWEKTWLCPVDEGTTQLSETGISVPFEVTACVSDGETGWLISDGDLYRTDGETFTPYADLEAAGIDISNIKKLTKAGSSLMILCQDELVMLAEEAAEVPLTNGDPVKPAPSEKQVIRMASLWSSNYTAAIAEFNRENEHYIVENTAYSSIPQLNLAVANGEADIVVSSDYNTIWNYADKGMLAPLDEVVPGLFRDGLLMDNVVDAMKLDDDLFFLAPSFNIETFYLPEEDVRDFSGMEEFIDFVDKTYTNNYTDPHVALFNILQTYGDIWLDVDAGKDYFAGESFRRVLEFCNSFPVEFIENYENEPYPTFAGNFSNFKELTEEEKAEGQWTWLPTPIPSEKSEGVYLASCLYIGIAKDGNETGAGEFLSYVMLEGSFDTSEWNSFPTSISRLEEFLESNDPILDRPLFSDYGKEIILEYLSKADHVNQMGVELAQHVILPEADVYFNGDCTLEEAIERIQSRVSLYLAELG